MKPRWKQGSTWAATAAAIVGVGTYVPDGWKMYVYGAAALATIAGVWLSDAPAPAAAK